MDMSIVAMLKKVKNYIVDSSFDDDLCQKTERVLSWNKLHPCLKFHEDLSITSAAYR